MQTVDKDNQINTKVFLKGLAAGITAPILLFSDFSAPVVRIVPARYEPLYRPSKTASQSMRADMLKIGGDFKYVTRRYDNSL